ncbi:MAG: glycosyltransferase [Candidatus Margulisiibacteriota bacterium]
MGKLDLRGRHLVIIVTYVNQSVTANGRLLYKAPPNLESAFYLFFERFLPIIAGRDDLQVVVIDNCSDQKIVEYLKNIRQPNILLQLLPANIGKARAANDFLADNLDPQALPRTIWSIDPDILFDRMSFDYLAEAVENLPGVGMLGMRYRKNNCNPEIYVFLPPRNLVGRNGKNYSVSSPFMANVAGGIFAVSGEHLASPLNFRLFPMKEYLCYGPDDSTLYLYLKKHGLTSGYLNGALATHLQSDVKVAPELAKYMLGKKPN